ncbi:glycoside hydrolase superfamily [Fimicolochytrium jonesii]|uniref:glycoside hydrolase superfamily n=1 Tax=Fimicolochytrium jonesii TaxID=1396493 RepID=UPI0022FDB6E3|nr:glycoside hydrolase superfamily [Fimicolochytrium jonesii]KAI8816116.1 glycoside hydrolase superfamily [Fimicolochytrium jonesii]
MRSTVRSFLFFLSALLCVLSLGTRAPAVWAAPAAKQSRVTYDSHSVSIDGKRLYIWSGEFHPFRLPSPDLWKDVLVKFKAAGYNGVSIYAHWGYHCAKPYSCDFTGIRNYTKFFQDAKDVGIYVIARPGPYINAETSGGGFPGWLGRVQGSRGRTQAADYEVHWKHFMTAFNNIATKFQIDTGGTVILYQAENEYSNMNPANLTRPYMDAIYQLARKDGIVVPIFHNDLKNGGNWASGFGAPDMYAWDGYPNNFDCRKPAKWNPVWDDWNFQRRQANTPLFLAEFQAGSFDPWGGAGYDKCRELTNDQFERVFYKDNIGAGVTIQNFYMTYGGTNWGHLAAPLVYSSYDFGAPISESLSLTTKYHATKLIGYFLQASPDIANTVTFAASTTLKDVRVRALRNEETGAEFRILRQWDATSTAEKAFGLLDVAGANIPIEGNIQLHGRDSLILVANYAFQSQKLVYSTAEILTHAYIGWRDILVIYGTEADTVELLLQASTARPSAVSLDQQPTWFKMTPGASTVRINTVVPKDVSHILLKGAGGKDLLIVVASRSAAYEFWRSDSAAGPVIVRGSYLLRWATSQGSTMNIYADFNKDTSLEVFAPSTALRINQKDTPVYWTKWGSMITSKPVAGPPAIALPSLGNWAFGRGTPEIDPAFDDSTWTDCTFTTTLNPTKPPAGQPVLFAQDYKFSTGHVLYRGRFTGTGSETQILLRAQGASEPSPGFERTFGFAYSVWLNGVYLGSTELNEADQLFKVPPSAIRQGKTNVIFVLVDNMGINEAFGGPSDNFKAYRGLRYAYVQTSDSAVVPIQWKIQGTRGGEELVDTVRGPLNVGGLYGERSGWHLPSYPATAANGWEQNVQLPYTFNQPGVVWFRSGFNLNLAANLYVPVGIRFNQQLNSGPPVRAQIYVNGFQYGRYISTWGPQTTFFIPQGIIRNQGWNTIAIAAWGTATTQNLLGDVQLVIAGDVLVSAGEKVANVVGGDWTPQVYGLAPAAKT